MVVDAALLDAIRSAAQLQPRARARVMPGLVAELLRSDSAWSGRRLAKWLGVHPSTVSRWRARGGRDDE